MVHTSEHVMVKCCSKRGSTAERTVQVGHDDDTSSAVHHLDRPHHCVRFLFCIRIDGVIRGDERAACKDDAVLRRRRRSR